MAKEQELCTRGFVENVTVRAIDEEARMATFVAATEAGVETMYGREYLQMKGAQLDRYRKNPVVLDSHNRYEAGAIVGKGAAKIVNHELEVAVTFATTARAEEIWTLVKGGFLRALSVGFIPGDVQRVGEGEHVGTGEKRIEGPARIVKTWNLFEISVVPVPADGDALRRSPFGLPDNVWELLSIGAHTMAKDKAQESAPAVSAETEEIKAPAQERTLTPVILQTDNPEEVRVRSIRALSSRGLESVAEQCVLTGKTLEESRAAMLAEYTKRSASVGTIEPKEPEKPGVKQETERAAPTKMADVSDDLLLRSLGG